MKDEFRIDLRENLRWLETHGEEGSSASWYQEDLVDADLSGVTLTQAVLIESRFDTARLDGADLTRTQAGGSSFKSASLIEANFAKAVLAGTCFESAIATRASFRKTDLSKASFAYADLRGATLDGADCQCTVFTSADLRGASLVTAMFSECDFRNAQFADACFDRTVIDLKTRFDGAIGFEQARIVSVIVEGEALDEAAARAWLLSRAMAAP